MRARGLKRDPLETAVFFIDRCVGKMSIARPLREAGLRIELHDDHFQQDAPDQSWLPTVGELGWYVITRDSRIRYRHLEASAVRAARVGMFVIVAKNLTGAQTADVVLRARLRIRRFISKHRRPFVAKVYRDGRIERLPFSKDR